jgi:hypothetical protein
VTLAKVIRWNTGVTGLQGNVFFDKSVLFFEAPAAGANVSLTAADGTLTLTDTRTGRVLDREPLSAISQVILVGSASAHDVFNLYVAGGGIEGGVAVYGGPSGGDVMNVYGRTGVDDRIAVGAAAIDVNATRIDYSGIETTRVVTADAGDTVQMDTGVLAQLVSWWDPLDED